MQLLREHSEVPGTRYEECLLYGDGSFAILNEMDLHESTDNKGGTVLKFRGKFQEADAINKNKRSYPYDVLNENVTKLQEAIGQNGLIGELDHPADSIIHFKDASHKITKLWWDGKVLMGEGQVLSGAMGRHLRTLINDGVRIGISSRGVGNGKVNEDGILVIDRGYKLITFDCVADPSTNAAFQEKISNDKKESVLAYSSLEKNETRSIDSINETSLLLACLGGIIKQKTAEIRSEVR